MANGTSAIRAFLVKLGAVLVGLGCFLSAAIGALSFTQMRQFQQFWIWGDRLIIFAEIMLLGGITIALAFGTWVTFETSTRRTKILNILFNYAALLIVFGGSAVFLVASFLLSNAGVALTGMRCFAIGVFMLIIRHPVVRFFVNRQWPES